MNCTIKWLDVANGNGMRLSVFVSGCEHYCSGCFNSQSFDFNFGEEYTEELEQKIIGKMKNGYMTGLSILGGEPFHPKNRELVLGLILKFRDNFPKKDIWVFSGYLIDDLMAEQDEVVDKILANIDILVDGKYVKEQKDLMLAYRGSRNQRLIDVQATLVTKTVSVIADNKIKYFKRK